MSTPSHPCYVCGASVLEGADACAACGAEMTEQAYAIFHARQAGEQLAERWKNAAFMFSVLALGLGLALGTWLGGGNDQAATAATPGAVTGRDAEQLSEAQFNDLFMRTIDEDVHLNLVGWQRHPQLGLVLEMQPPTQERPEPLWEQLSDEEQRGMMGVIGVAYTRALVAADQPVDLREGHPAISLRYQGSSQPVALRDSTGDLRIFRSPLAPGSPESAPSPDGTQNPS